MSSGVKLKTPEDDCLVVLVEDPLNAVEFCQFT